MFKVILEKIEKCRTNWLWIVIVFCFGFLLLSGIVFYIPPYMLVLLFDDKISYELYYILVVYACTISYFVVLFLMTWCVKPNKYIWKSLLPKGKSVLTDPSEDDVLADYYGRKNNTVKMFALGLLIGFIAIGFAILCAIMHGDIDLYFEVTTKQILLIVFAFFMVIIQASGEEFWCRGFLYERMHEKYPLWLAILINGILFAASHILNEGVSFIALLDIVFVGISYGLLRWYVGNIWIVAGVHSAWNFIQAFIFGLPNSGIESGVSVFHLKDSVANNSLIYDYTFGVEGTIQACVVDASIGIIVIVLAINNGRIKELKLNREINMSE